MFRRPAGLMRQRVLARRHVPMAGLANFWRRIYFPWPWPMPDGWGSTAPETCLKIIRSKRAISLIVFSWCRSCSIRRRVRSSTARPIPAARPKRPRYPQINRTGSGMTGPQAAEMRQTLIHAIRLGMESGLVSSRSYMGSVFVQKPRNEVLCYNGRPEMHDCQIYLGEVRPSLFCFGVSLIDCGLDACQNRKEKA